MSNVVVDRLYRMTLNQVLVRRKNIIAEWLEFRTDRLWVRQLPNMVTTFRLIAYVPAYEGYLAISLGHWADALSWIALAGLITTLDILDGRLARRLHEGSKKYGNPPVISTYGALMDPVADKLVGVTLLWYFPNILYSSKFPVWPVLRQLSLVASRSMISIELALACIAMLGVVYGQASKMRAKYRGVATVKSVKVGANDWGKLKFSREAAALAVGYFGWIGLHATPLRNLAAIGFLCVLAKAIHYGCLSIKGHLATHFDHDPTS